MINVTGEIIFQRKHKWKKTAIDSARNALLTQMYNKCTDKQNMLGFYLAVVVPQYTGYHCKHSFKGPVY